MEISVTRLDMLFRSIPSYMVVRVGFDGTLEKGVETRLDILFGSIATTVHGWL